MAGATQGTAAASAVAAAARPPAAVPGEHADSDVTIPAAAKPAEVDKDMGAVGMDHQTWPAGGCVPFLSEGKEVSTDRVEQYVETIYRRAEMDISGEEVRDVAALMISISAVDVAEI